MANTSFLFVYGTLMRGYNNPFAKLLTAHSTFISIGSARGSLYRVDWYPGAISEPNHPSSFWGEIYHLHQPNELLEALDAYEEVGNSDTEGEYVRRIIAVETPTNTYLNCWVYLYNWPIDGLEPISNGRFGVE